jgi:hypothetical protein
LNQNLSEFYCGLIGKCVKSISLSLYSLIRIRIKSTFKTKNLKVVALASIFISLLEQIMKKMLPLISLFGFALIIQGCAIYPYGYSGAYNGYGYPYNGYNYGYQPYGYRPYGNFGWGGGYGRGFGWGGGYGRGFGGGGHGWGGGHGRH